MAGWYYLIFCYFTTYLCQHDSRFGHVQRRGDCSCKATCAHKNTPHKRGIVHHVTWHFIILILAVDLLVIIKTWKAGGALFQNCFLSTFWVVCLSYNLDQYIFLNYFLMVFYRGVNSVGKNWECENFKILLYTLLTTCKWT